MSFLLGPVTKGLFTNVSELLTVENGSTWNGIRIGRLDETKVHTMQKFWSENLKERIRETYERMVG